MSKKPKYGLGGFFNKMWKAQSDVFMGIADTGLSAIGLTDVIDKSNYQTSFGKKANRVIDKAAPIVGQAAATAIGGPMAGAALQGVQSIGRGINGDPKAEQFAQDQQNAENEELLRQQKMRSMQTLGNLPTSGVTSNGYYAKGGEVNPGIKRLRKVLPLNAAMYIGDLVGDKTPLTEDDLKDSELNTLRSAARTSKTNAGTSGKDIAYRDLNAGDYPASSMKENLQGYLRSPSLRMQTTIGGATLNQAGATTTLTDRFDFSRTNNPLPLSESSPYDLLRTLGGKYGSKEGEGTPVSIKLGNLKRPRRGEKFAKGGLLNPEYEVEQGEIVQGMDTILEAGNQLASDIHHVNGNKHSQGGTDGKGGERVFSDQLHPGDTSATYADVAKQLGKVKGKMESKLTGNEFQKNTATRMGSRADMLLDELFNHQEMSKPVSKTSTYAKGGPIKAWQSRLKSNNLYAGPIDGKWGKGTQKGYSEYTQGIAPLAGGLMMEQYTQPQMNFAGDLTSDNSGASMFSPVNMPKVSLGQRAGALASNVGSALTSDKTVAGLKSFGMAAAPYVDNLVNAFIEPPKPQRPMLTTSAQLNTNVDINPELAELSTGTRTFNTAVDNSTANSTVARANKTAGYAQSLDQVGKLYANKRREEQGLRNTQAQLDNQATNINTQLVNRYQDQLWGAEDQRRSNISANAANASLDVQGQIRDQRLDNADTNKFSLISSIYRNSGVVNRQLLNNLLNVSGGDKIKAAKRANLSLSEFEDALAKSK